MSVSSSPLSDGSERRRAPRFPLNINRVIAIVSFAGGSQRGRIRDLSPGGGFFIEIEETLAEGTEVSAKFTLASRISAPFFGKILRASDGGIVVQLEVNEVASKFLSQFIKDALDPDRSIASVRIQELKPEERSALETESALNLDWFELAENLDEDRAHQSFIETCLKHQRLDLALEKYRELKQTRPDLESIDGYLQQIAKILSFTAFQRSPDEKAKTRAPSWLLIIAMLIMAVVAILAALSKLRNA